MFLRRQRGVSRGDSRLAKARESESESRESSPGSAETWQAVSCGSHKSSGILWQELVRPPNEKDKSALEESLISRITGEYQVRIHIVNSNSVCSP